jgi:Anaphase-promoting complex subunit 4 WD40 domain/WD domain, G-beta repeat
MFSKKQKIGVVALAFLATGFGGLIVGNLAWGAQREAVRHGPAENSWEIIGVAQAKPQVAGTAGPPRFQVEHKSAVVNVAWSPDGKQVAVSTRDGTVRISESATGKEVVSFQAGNDSGALAFAPDGKSLAVLDGGSLGGIWNIATGKPGRNWGGARGNKAEHLAFTRDGQRVIGVGAGVYSSWSATTAESAMFFTRAAFAAIAADCSVFGWCDGEGNCSISRVSPPAFTGRSALQLGECVCIALGPEGRLLAVGKRDGTVQLWDLTQKNETVTLAGLHESVARLTFSADGAALAALSGDGTSIRVWDVDRNATRCQINHNRGEVGAFALSPEGKLLATAAKDGKTLFLWTATARVFNRDGPLLDLPAAEIAALWTDLVNADYDKADNAWRRLGAAGDIAIPFLREQIRALAVPAAAMKKIEKLVADLNAEKFTIREQASKQLAATGDLAIVPLQRMLEKPPSEEARERAKLLLKKLSDPVLTPERQRALDALDLLEQLGTAKAIALLEEIERDALIPQIRVEARRALQRMKSP